MGAGFCYKQGMTNFVFTCEHASHRIPAPFARLFSGAGEVLRSHRGWDEGAPEVAKALSREFSAPLVLGGHSRLLVDLNRTPDHPRAFSEFTRGLGKEEKVSLIRNFHEPHWDKVRKLISNGTKRGAVIHIGVHSFIPVFHGYHRPTRIGLLYDPSRKAEAEMALRWQKELKLRTSLAVHRNLPYRGTGNGLVTALREEFSPARYLGFELELNQLCLKSPAKAREIISLLTGSLRATLK